MCSIKKNGIESQENEQYLYQKIFPYFPEDMNLLIKNHSFERDSIGCSGSHIFIFDKIRY